MARLQRDRSKERFWRRAVQHWRHSGQSVRTFCNEQGLSEPSFYGWRRTLAERDQAADRARQTTRQGRRCDNQEPNGSVGPDFVPVQVVASAASPVAATSAAPPASAGIEIVVGAGRVVRVAAGFDTATLQRLLAVLEDRPC